MLSVLPFILLIISNSSVCTEVKWIPNTNFNLPSNFRSNRLPCSNETVVFPNVLSSAVVIEGDESLSGMILPNDGTIFLPRDGEITFEQDGTADGCKGGDTYYQDVMEWWWAQPDVWSSPEFNDATPDAERVPCYDDIVEFPKDARFTIWLPDNTQYIRGLRINNESFSQSGLELLRFDTYRANPRQTFLMNRNQETGIKISEKQCYTKAGCPCQDNPLQIICAKKYCKPIQCVNPIKPVGHCCNICGGSVAFDTADTFDMAEFRSLVEKYINENGGREKLAYHVGKLSDVRVQLVVVEKTQYESIGAAVVSMVNAHLQRRWVAGVVQMSLSGVPLSMTGFGGRVVLGAFVLVIVVVFLLYIGSYKKIPLPRYPIMRVWRSGAANIGVITRFQGRTESVVSLTRRESPPPYGDSAHGTTAFRNPLYESKIVIGDNNVQERLKYNIGLGRNREQDQMQIENGAKTEIERGNNIRLVIDIVIGRYKRRKDSSVVHASEATGTS
ncbi:Protein amnionless [Eumeta japonica]|uniref:Protein amnionless n=1 Tax=Eumeta variegata TaxID=151549 RepID=A0A4C1YDY6_EUMVA|nr:Protein amnionless [Eumeta japonica]